jgi:hypothetical protein
LNENEICIEKFSFFFASNMSTKLYHSLFLSRSPSFKKSHRLAENERTEQGKCNGTATLLSNKKNKLFQSSVPFTKKKERKKEEENFN